MSLLQLQDVAVSYQGQPVVSGIHFALEAGEIGCLLGASGSGKSSLLRAIAGFEPVAAGAIRLAGAVLSRPGHSLAPQKRGVGMVFQDHALFPHLTVAGNVGFGLASWPKTERTARVAELLALVGLAELGGRYPHELSGGQQQRVALARALAPKPGLLLLDEPFANLDVDLRERLSMEVRALLKASGTTALLVTHDQHEAFAMADRVGMLADGKLQQWDRPYALYHEPVNRRVADFVGEGAFLRGEIVSENCLKTELGEICRLHGLGYPPGTPIELLIRPDDIRHDDASPQTARVLAKAFRGADFLYSLELPLGGRILSLVPSHHDHALGEAIGIRLELDHVIAFPLEPGPAHR